MAFNLFRRKNKTNNEIIDETQINEVFSPEAKKMSKRKKQIIAIISLLMVVIIAFGSYILSLFAVKKDYEYIASLLNLPEPIQIESANILTHEVDDCTITYTVKANYTLVGRVVKKHYYFPHNTPNKISRYDFGMAWGEVANEENISQIKFRNDGRRFLHYEYPVTLNEKLGSREAIVNSISNNHLIHANNRVLKLIRNVKEGQYIKIEGYLVYVHFEYGYADWNSSLTRTDHGDGACEIFYVTNIIWLKQS